MEEKRPQKPMSIEQAGNLLAEKKETMAEDMKAESKKAPISMADIKDRKAYLIYGVSLLNDVSESAKNTWCALIGKPAALYATKNVAQMLRKFMVLRINGYSIQQIGHHLKTPDTILERVEDLAIKVVGEAITKSQSNGTPIIGG
uniref:Uncharacterized protein n=1 Tax=viral metagenome TaxID=1070528 RepID=A0A6M3IIX8_9ZZZZ